MRYADVLPLNFLMSLLVFTILLVIDLDFDFTISWPIKFIPFWYFGFVYLSILLTEFQERSHISSWTLVIGKSHSFLTRILKLRKSPSDV